MSLMRTFGGIAMAIAFIVSCTGADDGETPNYVVSDSAGITIVVNRDVDLPAWTIDSVPVVTIGRDGTADQVIAYTSSSVRLSDGRILISDIRANALKLYDSDGTYVLSPGRAGDGPGEFASVSQIFKLPGDSVAVRDSRRPRMTIFGADGGFVRTASVEPIGQRVPRIGGFLGGMRHEVLLLDAPFDPPMETGSRRDTVEVFVREVGASQAESVGRLPGVEYFDQVSPDFYSTWTLPFSRGYYVAPAEDRLWVGVSDQYELRAYGSGGMLEQIARVDRAPQVVSSDDLERLIEHQIEVADTEASRDMWRRAEDLVPGAPSFPMFQDLKVDQQGFVWVREYDLPWIVDSPTTWRVFTPEGVAVATARLPNRFQVHEIGVDYVLGRWEDSLNVHHVQVLPLKRQSEQN